MKEEARVAGEADRAVKFSQEIAMWQKALKKMKHDFKDKKNNVIVHPAVSIESRSNDHGVVLEKKRTEPLITKAYNAFRQSSNKHGDNRLLATEAYINQQKKIRETTLISGLLHA